MVILSLLTATVVAWRKRPDVAFMGTWFFVTLAPSSSIIPIATEVGAERRMYLPLIAIVIPCVVGGLVAPRAIFFVDRFAPDTRDRCGMSGGRLLRAGRVHPPAEQRRP